MAAGISQAKSAALIPKGASALSLRHLSYCLTLLKPLLPYARVPTARSQYLPKQAIMLSPNTLDSL
jgi:hypothetical protein